MVYIAQLALPHTQKTLTSLLRYLDRPTIFAFPPDSRQVSFEYFDVKALVKEANCQHETSNSRSGNQHARFHTGFTFGARCSMALFCGCR
jgi:hypothetical protein